jgi:hypothetical protein
MHCLVQYHSELILVKQLFRSGSRRPHGAVKLLPMASEQCAGNKDA